MFKKKAKKADREKKEIRIHLTKKCPKCYRYMDLKLNKCPSCGVRVGNVDEHGMAITPVNWKAYITAIAGWISFVVFIWWAFFK